MSSNVIDLAAGKLYVLANAYELDGRVTTHPDDARGFAPMNTFVMVEGDAAMIMDTGYTVHQETLLRQLETILTPSSRVCIFPLSLGEFRSVCNMRPIVERFDVYALYGPFDDGSQWVDFRPELVPPGQPVGGGKMANVDVRVVRSSGGPVDVDEAGKRRLQALEAAVRLLPTHWVYDEATRTLFSSDAFTHVWRPTADGPWVVTNDDDTTTLDDLVDYLVRTRFWWLAGANSEPLRRGLAEVFDTYEIDIVAPSFGCVLQGREVVVRHYELLQDALRILGERPSIGLSVGELIARGSRS